MTRTMIDNSFNAIEKVIIFHKYNNQLQQLKLLFVAYFSNNESFKNRVSEQNISI